jgi:hypothetical protein
MPTSHLGLLKIVLVVIEEKTKELINILEYLP